MQLKYFQQLQQHLKNPLAPIYCLSGEELLLVNDSRKAIREAAQQQGYSEEEIWNIDSSFDWQTFNFRLAHRSLFSNKQFKELRFSQNKLSVPASEAIIEYCKKPFSDVILLLIFPKLESTVTKNKWYKALEEVGITLALWPLSSEQFPKWLMASANHAKIKLSKNSSILLQEYCEGNLLAAQQIIDKLAILYAGQDIAEETIRAMISPSSQYDIFDFKDSLLHQNPKRLIVILNELHGVNTPPTLILWAVSDVLRQLIKLNEGVKKASDFEKLCNSLKIWSTKKTLYKKALDRLSLPHCYQSLSQIYEFDKIAKGVVNDLFWPRLTNFCLKVFCGK